MSWFPRVNRVGDVASGAGDLIINGESRGILAHAPQWFDDATVLYKGRNDQPFTYDIHTRVESGPHGPAANMFAAGGSNWTSTAQPPGCIWCWVSDQGQFGQVIEHGGDNNRRSIYINTDQIVREQSVNWCALESGYLTWTEWTREGTIVRGRNPSGQLLMLSKGLRGQPVPGGPVPFVLIQTNSELLLVRWGTTQGKRLALGEDQNLYPHAIWNPSIDMVDIVWNNAQGVLGRATVHPDETLADLGGPIVVDPGPGPTPIPPQQLAQFPRKLWQAPYFSFGRYGDTPLEQFAGNAIILVENETDPDGLRKDLERVWPLAQPMFVQAKHHYDPKYENTIIAWWTGEGTIAQLESSVRTALEDFTEKPVIAYLDRGEPDSWPVERPDWVTDRVWPAPQVYRKAGESLSAFDSRIRATLARLTSWGVWIMLTPRFDDPDQGQGAWTVDDTLAAMPYYERYVREYPVCGLMPFADRRGHGMAYHPPLMSWAHAFLNANPARPNRYDYWMSEDTDMETVLRNKLGQETPMVMLSQPEKTYLLDLMDDEDPDGGDGGDGGGGGGIDPDDDLELTQAEWLIVERMHDRFAGDFPETEDGARDFTEMVNQQLKYSFPRRGFCWKKASESRPPSKDSVCRQTPTRFGGWDILSGAGFQGPKVLVDYPPAYHDLAGQIAIEVTAKNHLGL